MLKLQQSTIKKDKRKEFETCSHFRKAQTLFWGKKGEVEEGLVIFLKTVSGLNCDSNVNH
jgi:hypothetical protein